MTMRHRIAAVLLSTLFALNAHAGGGRNRVVGSEMPMPPVRVPVTVDGDLGEWNEGRAKLLTLATGGGEEVRSESPLLKHFAKIAFQYDQDALYVAVWFNDPTPLGPETSPDYTPPGDGLILSLPLNEMTHVAFWREPGGTAVRSLLSVGDIPLAQGREMKTVTQGYKVTGNDSYTQEVRIPWSELGGRLKPGDVARLGIELCFGGLNPAANYQAWQRDNQAGGTSTGNRFGGGMGWGFVDGIRDASVVAPGFDPANGAEVKLLPAGSVAPANPAVMYNGNEQTRTTAMIAVPAAKIAVDGKLEPGEWDARSATTVAYEPAIFPNRYAVDVHWAYDEQGLYAGLRWRTGGPHLNVNDPATMDRGYDGGDALQLRIGADRVTHVDAWYHDATKTPCVGLIYGAKFNEGSVRDATAKGARMAIHPAASGQGYTQELFLPWSLITRTGAPLKAGDAFRVILDVFFSGLEGNRIPFIVNTRVVEPSGVVALPFTAPADGYYTVVVEDAATGRTVRRLVTIERMRAGQRVEEWDGLDDQGAPVPAGDYRFRGLHHGGIGLQYLMTLNNPGTPPWQTDAGDGEWGGDHSAPATIAADDASVYIGWHDAEDGDGIIGCTLEGRKSWGVFGTDGRAHILAVDGPNLYVATGDTIACLDKKTGSRRGFSVANGRVKVPRGSVAARPMPGGLEWDLRQAKRFSLETAASRDDYYLNGRCKGVGGGISGLAARDGKLYVSFLGTDELVVLNAADMTELARWTVARPAGLAFSPGGDLYAISDKGVARIGLHDGTAVPVVSAGLDAPVDLAIGPDGALYVSQWGAAHCVAVFDAQGNPIRTIGTPGGRPWEGAYDANGMLMPRGIAIDAQGRLWVAEYANSPRRVSVWVAASGQFIREFVGGTVYGATEGGLIDPANPTRAFSDGVWYEIDLSKEGYRPLLTLRRRQSIDDGFAPFEMARGNNIHSHRIVNAANGRRYLVTAYYASPIVIGELRPDYSWQPSVAIGLVTRDKLGGRSSWPAFFAKHAGETYIWTDANGDGIPKEDEFQWRKGIPAIAAGWGTGVVDAGMNVYGGMGEVTRFTFQGWGENGIPRYDINAYTTVADHGSQCDSVAVDSRQWVFTLGQAERRGGRHSLSAFDPDGNRRWSIPTSTDYRRPDAISGEALLGPVAAGGELGEIIGVTQWHGLHVPLITTDGLLFAKLLRDPAGGGKPGPDMYKGETIQYLSGLHDGRVILAHGKNAHHFLQVTGLETVRRFDGAFTVTPEQAKLAAERLKTRQEKTEAAAPIRITWRAHHLAPSKPAVIDGNLDDWDWPTAGAIGSGTGVPRAEVALRLAAPDQRGNFQELHIAFKVFKNGPFLNTGKDDATRLFLTGDAVDLHFSTDPAALPRQEPGLGDSRLLFSKLDGNPVAVLYRAQVPNARNPVGFSSPSRTVTIDEVTVLKDARVAIADTADGYVVEAAVPLGVVSGGLQAGLWPGRILPGDAGIVVGDTTGRRVARIYRFNQNTQVVSDVPTEAALYPAQWGTLKVDQETSK